MSKICIGVIKNISIAKQEKLREMIDRIVKEGNYGVFFEDISYEPFFAYLNEDDIVFSLADNYDFDNCEELLLRDNCSINGRFSKNKFEDKMKFIQGVISVPIDIGCCLEMYIGDSGTLMADYNDVLLEKNNFVSFMMSLNQDEYYHLVVR